MQRNLTTLHSMIEKRALIMGAQKRIVTSSGKEGAWMFDFRAVLLDPVFLDLWAELVWEELEPLYPFQVGGQETAAIPLVTALVLKSLQKGKKINGFYIRKSRKRYDLQQHVEGTLTDAPIVLLDDLINSGGSIDRQVHILEGLGKRVCAVHTIVRFRDEAAYAFLQPRAISLRSFFTVSDFNLTYTPEQNGFPSPQEWYRVLWYGKGENPTFTYSVPKSAPIIDEERLYLGGDSGYFWAIRQSDGTEAWRFKVGKGTHDGKNIFSSPALHKGTVYFGAYDGNVYALDTKTGTLLWKYTDADWVGSSPVVAPDVGLVFIGLEFGLFGKRGGIVALDMQTGGKTWGYTVPGLVHASPGYSIAHGVVGVGSNNGVFYLFEARTGNLRWQHTTMGEIKYGCAFDEERGLVFFGSLDGNLYAVDIKTGELRHTYKTEAGIYSTPLVAKDTVYIGSLDKQVYAFEIDTGKVRWVRETNGRIFSSPAFIDQHLFIGSNDGRLYEIDPTTGKILTFFQTTERVVNKIVYNPSTKRFFLPTFANEIYCLTRKEN